MFERFQTEAREAVMRAVDVAEDVDSGRVGPEHLLVGLAAAGEPTLAAAGLTRQHLEAALRAEVSEGADAAALRAIGIDLDAIRAAVDGQLGAGAWEAAAPARRRRERGLLGRLLPAQPPFTPAARKVLELGLREAIAEQRGAISATHLLCGLLRDPGPTATAMIATVLPVDELRRRAAADPTAA